jgi:hypothetical protein
MIAHTDGRLQDEQPWWVWDVQGARGDADGAEAQAGGEGQDGSCPGAVVPFGVAGDHRDRRCEAQ